MYQAESRPSSFYQADPQSRTPSISSRDLINGEYPLHSSPDGRKPRSRSRPPRLSQAQFDQGDPDAPDAAYAPDGDDFYQSTQQGSPYPPPPRSLAGQSARGASPTPILDHSHLQPGSKAALLSHERTLELYRANAKKTQDPDLQFEFAVFMIDASKTLPVPEPTPGNVMEVEKALAKREDLIKEATALLKRLADRGHPASQYFLADCYANGIGTAKGKQDFDRAFPLFVLAAKHGHPDAAYRAGTCCENGWGCRRESAKALQFYRKAAAASHPGAMYRLGIAELNGELGMSKRPREGVKWLKRSAEHATAEFPHALHELALLHERGVENVVFVDYEYAAELLAQAAELGYSPSAYRLGECYEYGKMGCPQDPALSIHYYNIAAQQNHRDACFALTAWYLVGSPGVLPQSDTEAFLWAKKAAEGGLAKAMYAVGYFLEVGIGTPPDLQEATMWYKKAAELGDRRAIQRLRGDPNTPLQHAGGPGAVLHRDRDGDSSSNSKGGKDKDCVIM
ncbi:HCP-like protein [Gloeophyllum trabeum ATCC 11539]|uniref:HCP-like protein n=1 Tax=Gloeophyllum trabeum (strain ATCC 11539 / FP-39264 / Madison 617) TaxID=670483 RepID=S7R6Q6_GLOTA|nr:HCP-like protein [Gloeophyllum trabeum ATCC 11539]EPQ50070.1 HCP-like protein [Gloeophyllum trabeum ATCC 11539]